MFYIGHAAPVATDTNYLLKPVQALCSNEQFSNTMHKP